MARARLRLNLSIRIAFPSNNTHRGYRVFRARASLPGRSLRVRARVTAIESTAHLALEFSNHLVDVKLFGTAEDNIVPAAIQRITGIDDDLSPAAGETSDFQAAYNAGTEQMARMQAIFGNDVIAQLLKIIFGEKLAGKKSRP